ncbi:MAG: ATP-binding protein [Gammaproteobacteria bacterium]|nr:ATP-binding protein [Gammaproteobacteria bacterium]
MENNDLALSPDILYHACDMSLLTFNSTDEIMESKEIVGQSRAVEALDFGVGINHDGYNLFVLGSTGLGKNTLVEKLLKARATDLAKPDDWCYINNFDKSYKPKALKLPAGYGRKLQADMNQLVEDLLSAIPSAFETDEYNAGVKAINDELENTKETEFVKLAEKATRNNVALMRTPGGYTLGPMKDGKILTPDEFEKLTDDERENIKNKINEIENELNSTIRKLPVWEREARKKIKVLNREVSQSAVAQFIDELRASYSSMPDVLSYINDVRKSIIEDADAFRKPEPDEYTLAGINLTGFKNPRPSFSRYQVNLLVDNSDTEGAPVIFEDNPTYNNLIGRIDHIAQFGALVTDFTLIKAGALHRANGGFLVFDARRVLTSPFAWDSLKRALRSRDLRIEALEKMLSISSTISLEPEPIPIEIKVVLTGDRWLYYLLKKYDPEFNQLFKVAADFSEDIDRDTENTVLYSQMIGELLREKKFKPFDPNAVALVIESSARAAEDAEKLSLHKGNLIDLLREADYWAGEAGHELATREDVQRALDTRIRRVDQLRERVHEQVLRGNYLLETEGGTVAQVNALSIIQLGDYAFARPSRITATARLGSGKVIDIEREVELGGSIHSKGVLILSSYLANRYARDQPLSLSASLVFEQSYGMVDGDSASVAELCALLSALSKIPIDQSFAITGSVNQHGQIQPIGGVNEKIEGFFDICKARTLTGSQGVIIPASNVKHLMLRSDVVESVRNNQFNVYAVETADQVMELVTGKVAGEADEKDEFPKGSINHKVKQSLVMLNRQRQKFAKHSKSNNNDSHD